MRALEGDAGRTVRAAMLASHATRLVRVVGWPAALVAEGDAVYVNAAWLVAVAPPVPAPSMPAAAALPLAPKGVHPLVTLGGSSLAACVSAATQQCQACLVTGGDGGTACNGPTALSDATSLFDECNLLNARPSGFEQLC